MYVCLALLLAALACVRVCVCVRPRIPCVFVSGPFVAPDVDAPVCFVCHFRLTLVSTSRALALVHQPVTFLYVHLAYDAVWIDAAHAPKKLILRHVQTATKPHRTLHRQTDEER